MLRSGAPRRRAVAIEVVSWQSMGASFGSEACGLGSKDSSRMSSPKTYEHPAWDRALLERFLDGAPIGLVVLDPELRFLRVNSRAAVMLGVAEQALIGDRFEDALPAMFAELEGIVTDIVAGGEAWLAVETSAPTPRSGDAPRRYLASYYPLEGPGGGLIGVGCMFADITEQRAAEHALADSEKQRDVILGEMLRAEEAERSRLALGLHDDTIQVMCALLVLLDRVIPLALRHEETEISSQLQEARRVLLDATDRARRLMFDLHPSLLHQRGLNAALTALADDTARQINGASTVDVADTRYTWELEELVYRVVGEALANIGKHSHATRFSIHLSEQTRELHGVVRDNGCGFPVEAAKTPLSHPLHLGLHSMTERVRLAGGETAIRSVPGGGTTIDFRFPLDQRVQGWHTPDPR
jgi:signal transduction histidine kinase